MGCGESYDDRQRAFLTFSNQFPRSMIEPKALTTHFGISIPRLLPSAICFTAQCEQQTWMIVSDFTVTKIWKAEMDFPMRITYEKRTTQFFLSGLARLLGSGAKHLGVLSVLYYYRDDRSFNCSPVFMVSSKCLFNWLLTPVPHVHGPVGSIKSPLTREWEVLVRDYKGPNEWQLAILFSLWCPYRWHKTELETIQ